MPLTAREVHKMKYAQPSTEGVLPVILERWSPPRFCRPGGEFGRSEDNFRGCPLGAFVL